MDNSILNELMFEPGRLVFKEVRYLLIRPEVVASLHKALEAEVGPERCAAIMTAAGNVGGSKSSQKFREVFGYSDREIAEFMCRMGREIGWGIFSLEHLDVEGGELVITVSDSPFAAAYGPAEAAVCHLIRGVTAGIGAAVFGAEAVSAETACAASGGTACRFEVHRA